MSKYNIFKLPWPEPASYDDADIVWWRKGDETNGLWYKGEAPNYKIIALGDTVEELTARIISEVEALDLCKCGGVFELIEGSYPFCGDYLLCDRCDSTKNLGE